VEKFIDTPVKRYSSGMYVRLAFAVAAHLDPEILVVDEVLAVGDAEFQKKCLGKMGDVASEGRTVLFVSHNMGAINTLCERVLWVDNGNIKRNGEPPDVINMYLNSGRVESKSGIVNLIDWNKRYGDGEAKMLKARLLDYERNINTIFYRTKPLIVQVEFISYMDVVLNLSMTITNSMGVTVLHLSQFDSSNTIIVKDQGKYRYQVTIHSLPLFKGDYTINLGIHHDGRQSPVDVVKEALAFSVEEPLDSSRPHGTQSTKVMAWTPSKWICEKTK